MTGSATEVLRGRHHRIGARQRLQLDVAIDIVVVAVGGLFGAVMWVIESRSGGVAADHVHGVGALQGLQGIGTG